jgi:hypothetical protein
MLRSAVHYTVYKISEACSQQFKVEFSKESILAIADHIFRVSTREIGVNFIAGEFLSVGFHPHFNAYVNLNVRRKFLPQNMEHTGRELEIFAK